MSVNAQGGLGEYLRSKDFRYTVVAILIFFGISMLVGFLWLKIYTHHGQELKMPDYTGIQFEEAVRDAQRHKFRMSIQDSLHILGKPGGEIIKQNPNPGSLVKQNRMIYVTITKRSPDKILSGRLPEMYGKSYDRKKQELEEHFEIKSRISDTRYDPGDPGQVLEVQYKGVTIMDAKGRDNTVPIEKGDYLDFIVSSKTGGKVEVPDLVCKTYEEAQFLLENLGLKVSVADSSNDMETLNGSFVIAQDPPADGSVIDMESTVNITLSMTKPSTCK
jgi:beta-lactam-binding protein with PASTA domain